MQLVYSGCTVLMVSFGGFHFLRMVYNLINVSLKKNCIYIYKMKKNPNCYHCEMLSFNWTVNITFVRALTHQMTSRSHDGQYSTSTHMYAYAQT